MESGEGARSPDDKEQANDENKEETNEAQEEQGTSETNDNEPAQGGAQEAGEVADDADQVADNQENAADQEPEAGETAEPQAEEDDETEVDTTEQEIDATSAQEQPSEQTVTETSEQPATEASEQETTATTEQEGQDTSEQDVTGVSEPDITHTSEQDVTVVPDTVTAEASEQDVTGEQGPSEQEATAAGEQVTSEQDVPSEQDEASKSEETVTGTTTTTTESSSKSEPSKDEGKAEQEQGEVTQKAAEDGEEKTEGEEGDEESTEQETTDGQKPKEKPKEEKKKIPEDFYYNLEDFMSKPFITDQSGLPPDMLVMQHSFGYDCKRRANLHMLDEETLIFIAGNFIQLLSIKTKQQTYLRSTSGGGIGAIAIHPKRTYFAVGEKGNCPNINIFEYPSLKLYRMLRAGTEKAFASLDYSRNGELLASVGKDPDFMLTVWDWRQEQIMLRTKAFSQDVFRVTFSTDLEGQLTTAGIGHIRFWKMADTFTGLKLQGELGRFGRTEISDIEGYVELPDGKVLSGSEWGNMLLWDGGLIKVEITRKNKKQCHSGPIQQILLDEGELMTIGIDGFVRVWDFETIDTADSSDDSGLFEMEPMNELKVGYGDEVQLRTIIKSVDEDNEPTMWYVQDGNGGIWRLDLSFSHTSLAPEKFMTYHAGPILGCGTSPITHLVATTGSDNTVRIFDYSQAKQLSEVRYNSGGTCLIWVPPIIDPKGKTVIAGFEDGVVRVMTVEKHPEEIGRRPQQEIDVGLKQVFKPHKNKVAAIAIDSKGEIFVSGGADCTLFFMNIGPTFEPIGFITTPTPVRHLQWSPDNFSTVTLLVVCEEGIVLEVDCPHPGKFDTSHTYQINDLPVKTFKFKSVKSTLRHEEELEMKRIEEEARKKREEQERRERIERGLEDEEGEDEEEKAPPEPEPDWHPYIPEDPSPILEAFYSDKEGHFWLSMGEFDAGYLYECKFMTDSDKTIVAEQKTDIPLKAVPVLESNDVPISVIRFSNTGEQALMGMENGVVRIQQLHNKFDLTGLGPQWSLNVHDNNYGSVTCLVSSYNGLVVISVGADGNFFMYSFMEHEKILEEIKKNKAKIPSARKSEEKIQVDDIDDPSAYSIEDAKQKAEYDKMMKEAEEKKREARLQIAKLRRQFKMILEKNDSLPKNAQLEKVEFEMDREIKLELHRQTQEKIDLVRKELAWESEKYRIALEKLQKRFKNVVECERVVVKSFVTTHEVCSYRTSKLSEDFYQLKATFEERSTMHRTKDDLTRDSTNRLMAGKIRSSDTEEAQGDKKGDQVDSKVQTSLKGSMGERITKALQKVEEKKKKRQERKNQWTDLYNTKPADDYEDPADVAAITEAKDNMGDYKLKTAKDYVVPDHLRMNVDKARCNLLVLKDLIHEHKYNFNVRLLAIRDGKIQIIEEIKDLVTQLSHIQSKLPESKQKPIPPVPKLHPDELPEKKLEYTRDSLISFKKQMEEQASREKQESQAQSGFGGGGFSGPGFGGASDSKVGVASSPALKQYSTSSYPSKTDTELVLDVSEAVELSPLELEIQKAEEIRNMYLQDTILKKIDEMLKKFDAELRLLRHDKFKYDIMMKNADLRQVTLFEELVLLKEYEKREDVIAAKVMSKQQEKLEMQAKINDVQLKLEAKKKDIEKLQEKERSLHATFVQSLGENNKFGDYLNKVFKKRIKRTKKKATEGEGSGEDSDEDSDDESDWEESDEESDEESGGYDLDACPSGCDQALYDNTCQLREKRLDIEEALTEEKKNSEALRKENEALAKKAKVIDSALKTAHNDLEAFQLEKQQKLNELDVVVTLKLHQIQYMINGLLPQDLSQTLVFESSGVVRLQQRIHELEHEKSLQKKQMKEARRTHVQLIKDRKTFDRKIEEMEEQCNELMVGKFGRIVDLEKLETITVNRTIEELKEKMRNTEMKCSEELSRFDEELNDKRNRITYLIRMNTQRLQQLNMLMTEKGELEKSLDSRQRNLGEEYSGQRKSDIHEKQRLIQLVQLQAQEIDALKEEIMLLSRKGGHILPPAQPPLPQSPTNLHTISH